MKYALLIICIASQLYGAAAECSETRIVDPGTVLEAYNKNGDIIVTGWQGDKVEISILKETNESADELDKVTYEITNGTTLRVKTKYQDEDAKVTVTFKIKVPAHVYVGHLETANGNIELTGTTIKSLDADYKIVLSSANGDIVARDNKGTLRIRTANGDITVKGKNTICEANTANGSIKAKVTTVPKEGVQIITANGSITLQLAPDLDCDITATAVNGHISVQDLDLNVRKKNSISLTGSLGGGGPCIEVTTTNGEIMIYNINRLPYD